MQTSAHYPQFPPIKTKWSGSTAFTGADRCLISVLTSTSHRSMASSSSGYVRLVQPCYFRDTSGFPSRGHALWVSLYTFRRGGDPWAAFPALGPSKSTDVFRAFSCTVMYSSKQSSGREEAKISVSAFRARFFLPGPGTGVGLGGGPVFAI